MEEEQPNNRSETCRTATLGWLVLSEVPACPPAFIEGLVYRTYSAQAP